MVNMIDTALCISTLKSLESTETVFISFPRILHLNLKRKETYQSNTTESYGKKLVISPLQCVYMLHDSDIFLQFMSSRR